jgi:hypothetical protein
MGFAADAPTADLSEQLMNRDNCLFNRISVVILQGKVSPRNMQTVEFANLKKIALGLLMSLIQGRISRPYSCKSKGQMVVTLGMLTL